MQKELVQQKHIDLLKKALGITFENIEKMTDEEYDAISDKIVDLVCDSVDTEDFDTAEDIADIVFGPYNHSEVKYIGDGNGANLIPGNLYHVSDINAETGKYLVCDEDGNYGEYDPSDFEKLKNWHNQ